MKIIINTRKQIQNLREMLTKMMHQKLDQDCFSANASIVAAFDFDGTLTDRDSLVPLLVYWQGALKTYAKLATLTPAFIGFLLNQDLRQHVKEQILTHFFGGLPLSQLQEIGESYAQQALNCFIKPEALKRLKWHQEQGHYCVLVSASIDTYLVPWAKAHGFQHVIASRLEVTPDGYVTGKLKGLNCWGPEKVRRLEELLGSKKNYFLYAYGDSRGDQELLALADRPYYRRFN